MRTLMYVLDLLLALFACLMVAITMVNVVVLAVFLLGAVFS